jgi:hypothetical protein
MHLRSAVRCGAIMLFLAASAQAGTAVVLYQTISLGGGIFRYNYSIFNNAALGPGVPIELFDVLFDPALYQESSLAFVSPPPLSTQWSEMVFTSVPPLPALYDVLANTGGIPDGGSVSGFSVQFAWLGQGTPGSQPFRIYDSQTFDLLLSGTTASAPEPSTVALLATSLACVVFRYRRRRNCPERR